MNIKQILHDSGFRFNKQFGQNFLTDDAILDGIVRDAGISGGTVLEIGAGAGTLTRRLSLAADKVVAFEIDRNLEKVLAVTLADCPNTRVIIDDVMKRTVPEIEKLCGGEYKVVANIPYYITTPLLMNFIEKGENVLSLTLTVQKEVAERLTALPGTKEYGAVTVGVDAVARAKITSILSRNLFYPVPEVDSAVVRIDVDRNKYDISDAAFFRKTVKAAFAMRRKTLCNNLTNGFGISREKAENIIKECGLPEDVRGERLDTACFVELSRKLKEAAEK